ncbi:MAG: serine--tRNA ligase [Proteobacteria bacterium]|nr:MAG: serine--tRNA ligase [Pseudomonadota bacterium]
MLDIKFIRENKDLVSQAAKDKRFNVDLDTLLRDDEKLRSLQAEMEQLQAERNRVSKQIASASPSERDTLKAQVSGLKPRLEALETEVRTLGAEVERQLLLVPAPARSDVPVGKDDAENVEVKRWGTVREYSFKFKTHMELGEKLDIVDVDRGVKIAGSRSYVLKGWGARLEQAILRLTLDKLNNKGYTQLAIPVLVNEDAMTGTGYFPGGRDQAYLVERDGMALVGTAEVSLTSYHAQEILKEETLPLRYMAMSSCFRREAGTYGKDAHGLYRVHQFLKVEQVIIAKNDVEGSEVLHNELLNNAEEILQDLELPYRVVYVCTGDLGQGQVRKHDIETWMPSRKAYSETHSCSTFHDFQARRLKIRYKDAAGQNQICHTLNNTAIASPRVLIPFLETHQQEDGSILIPKALRPYLGTDVIR